MLRNAPFSAGFATCWLVIYTVLLHIDATYNFAAGMLLLSPAIIIWMVLTVLKHGKYTQAELNDEEFGYQDKSKDELGIF